MIGWSVVLWLVGSWDIFGGRKFFPVFYFYFGWIIVKIGVTVIVNLCLVEFFFK